MLGQKQILCLWNYKTFRSRRSVNPGMNQLSRCNIHLDIVNVQYTIPVGINYYSLQCWLGSRKGIQPVKMSGGVVAWLSVWSKVQTCIWPSWCHCHPLSLCFIKIQIGFTFLVPAHPVCVCVCVCVCVGINYYKLDVNVLTVLWRHSSLCLVTC